jgi:hypothetical protein
MTKDYIVGKWRGLSTAQKRTGRAMVPGLFEAKRDEDATAG